MDLSRQLAFFCALGASLFSTFALTGCSSLSPAPIVTSSDSHEDIFVMRSRRDERVPNSAWCSKERTGADPYPSGYQLEDVVSMWSISVQAEDARTTSLETRQVGYLRTCLGTSADPKAASFYFEGKIGQISISGSGPCAVTGADFPQVGLSTASCRVIIRSVSAPYVGGQLTTNTLGSRAVLGGQTDPRGYTQQSVATLRLWR
jgi:hypothetical protein